MSKYKTLTPEEKKQKQDDYERKIADLFIKGMETNTLPWQKPWNPGINTEDFNMMSMKKKDKNECYQGMNSLILELTRTIELSTDDPRWLTFIQMKDYNSKIKDEKEQIHLKKGSIGTTIKVYKPIFYDKDGKYIPDVSLVNKEDIKNVKPMFTTHIVFNASQFGKFTYDKDGNILKDKDGNYIYRPAFEPLEVKNNTIDFKPLHKPENLIKNNKVNLKFDQIDRCFYRDSDDCIHMVAPNKFNTITDYYDTLLHEFTHWTGNFKRLDREEARNYGSSKISRAKEELVAEIGGFMLAKECKVNFTPTTNNIAYVESWIQNLKDKPQSIFEAVGKAKASTDYIIENAKNNKKENVVITKLVENNEIKKGKGRT